jgi:hypothetical protein
MSIYDLPPENETEQPTVYRCTDCEIFYDEDGNEVTAPDYINYETELCYDCKRLYNEEYGSDD